MVLRYRHGAAGSWLIMATAIVTVAGCHDKEPVAPELEPGAVRLEIDGLPAGTNADVRITGPRGFFHTEGKSNLIAPAPAGRYSIHANDVRSGGFTWTATPSQLDTVLAEADTLLWHTDYAVATGALAISINGLPGGVSAAVRVVGNGLTRTANGSVILADLPPGTYNVFADSLNAGGTAFTGTAPATATISASVMPTAIEVHYSNVTGALKLWPSGVEVPGAPAPAPAPAPADNSPQNSMPFARIQGPLNTDTIIAFDQSLSQALRLPVGSYTITPGPVVVGNRTFGPTSRSLTRTINSATRDSLVIAYQELKTPVNASIDNVTVTQSVQRSDNGIPLLVGRQALLRAFVRADRPGTASPPARVRVFDGNTVIATLPLTAPSASIPTVLQDADMASTYQVVIPGTMVRQQFRVAVDLDPDSTIGEVQRGDNVWPQGAPFAPNMVTAPPFTVRFVPIMLNNTVGNVNSANRERFLALTRALWPVVQVNSDVRAPFITSVETLDSTDSNGGWATILNELRTLMVIDGANPGTHYYGVVQAPYEKGVFGLALVAAPAAVGWDRSDADTVAAHEWGHNFGRYHAPCGNAPATDPGYPGIGAATGIIGWNNLTGMLQPANLPDIMSYCTPAWVSEYNYTNALLFRQVNTPSVMAEVKKDGLLVWGRIEQSRIVVEPAFRVEAANTVSGRGALESPYVVELLDKDNAVIERQSLNTELVAHSRGERQFATVIGWNDALERRLAAIRVRDVRSLVPSATRSASDSTEMGLLRDSATGKVRGFVRKHGVHMMR